jgi:hypothetical protein
MANVDKVKEKKIIIHLDKPRELIFTLGALADLEEEYGSFQEAIKTLQTGSIKSLIKLLHVGFQKDDPELTIEEVRDIAGARDFKKLQNALKEALGASMPDPDPKKKKKK